MAKTPKITQMDKLDCYHSFMTDSYTSSSALTRIRRLRCLEAIKRWDRRSQDKSSLTCPTPTTLSFLTYLKTTLICCKFQAPTLVQKSTVID